MAPSARIALTFSKENQRLDGSVYRFGDFVLQPTERMLAREGVLIPIQPKTFDALLLLVIHAGHLVSKTELMGSLWPDTHVREANLTNVIVSLRKLLGRESIRTVSKHGYRFDMPILCEPGVDRDGYESFLEARSIIQARSLQDMPRARELLTLSIAKSPTFAQGWAWLGRGCLFLNKFSDSSPLNGDIAQASLERALILQSDLTDAHAFLTMYEVDSGRALEAVVRLAQQLTVRPKQPDLYAGLVHTLRFRGLLAESLQADEYARELDPQTPTSIAHTLFLIGDFAGCIEAYAGRTPYYLDAAAWAALGMSDRAASLLMRRIATLPLSSLLRALLESLLHAITGEPKKALKLMELANTRCEPEIQIYFARHFSYLKKGEEAVRALEAAAELGFVSAPEMLRNDPWLSSARQSTKYRSLLEMSVSSTQSDRKKYQRATAAGSAGV
jgi:DNA-binding winged helix-turn-helix (wHTH) protein/tetratricopeptide (TPR) repeat protein